MRVGRVRYKADGRSIQQLSGRHSSCRIHRIVHGEFDVNEVFGPIVLSDADVVSDRFDGCLGALR